MSDQTAPKPVGFFCNHEDEPADARTHHGWGWSDNGLVWQHQPEVLTAHHGAPKTKGDRLCDRAVPIYAVDVLALVAELATVQQERQDFAVNLEAFLAADPEQRGLSGLLQVERTHRRHAEDAWERAEAERDAALTEMEERGKALADWQRVADEHQRAMFDARNERDQYKDQRDQARAAVDRADRIARAAGDTEKAVSAQELTDAIADVAQLCPGCWRTHGLWCHPYGGPLADPDPTAYQRAISGAEADRG